MLVTPMLGVLLMVILAVVLSISASLVYSPLPTPEQTAFQYAIVVPAALMCLAVATTLAVLVLAFRKLGAAVSAILAIRDNALTWRGDTDQACEATAKALDDASAVVRCATFSAHAGAASDARRAEHTSSSTACMLELADAMARHARLSAVSMELTRLVMTIDHLVVESPALRFMLMLKPGAVSFGSAAIALITTIALVVRLVQVYRNTH